MMADLSLGIYVRTGRVFDTDGSLAHGLHGLSPVQGFKRTTQRLLSCMGLHA